MAWLYMQRLHRVPNMSEYALIIARFQVQYGQYFQSFPYFAELFHEPLDK